MNRRRLLAAALLIAPLLGGCRKADNAAGPGGISVGEARRLDDAAAHIDAERPPAPPVASSNPSPPPPASAEPTPR